MTLWHSRITDAENDQQLLFDEERHAIMRKAASMANLWPRPSTSPSANHTAGIQDRSPFPPRISSLNRVPPLGWDCGVAATPARTKRPATAHASAGATADSSLALARAREPGTTAHAPAGSGIARASAGASPGTSGLFGAQCQQGSGTPLPRLTTSHLDTSPPLPPLPATNYYSSDNDTADSQFSISRRSSSLYILDSATSASSCTSPATTSACTKTYHSPGYAFMPTGALDLRTGHTTSHQLDLSPSFSLPYFTSPTMRKASPMPQALPQPSPSSSPWHHTTSTLVSPTDSAPAAGKTSQVLAKLTADCDRLRREIKAEKAAREEAVQQFQALKTRVNWLEEKNSMLSLQLDTNGNALARKERRMDDLKAGLEEEVARRKRAEEREAEMGRKLGETVSQAAKEVSEAHTARKAAENAYATLENEYSGLTRRIAFLRKEVETLTSKINENSAVHKRQVLQLEVLVDQQRQAQEKSERQVGEMASLLRSYRETEENTKRLEGEMQRAVHEMRWVMRLHESRTGQAQAQPGADEEREVRVEVRENGAGARRHQQKQSQSSIQASSPKQRRKQAPAPAVNGVAI